MSHSAQAFVKLVVLLFVVVGALTITAKDAEAVFLVAGADGVLRVKTNDLTSTVASDNFGTVYATAALTNGNWGVAYGQSMFPHCSPLAMRSSVGIPLQALTQATIRRQLASASSADGAWLVKPRSVDSDENARNRYLPSPHTIGFLALSGLPIVTFSYDHGSGECISFLPAENPSGVTGVFQNRRGGLILAIRAVLGW